MSSSANIELGTNQSAVSSLAAHLWQLFFLIRFALSQFIVAFLNKIDLSSYLVARLHTVAANRINANDYSRAETAYWLILRLRDNDRDATIQLADLFDDKAMLRRSTMILDNWLDRFPNDVEAHAILSKYYSQMSETAKAKNHLGIATGLAPNSSEVLEAFGYFHRWNGNLDESSRFFKSALNVRQKPSALFFLAENLIDAHEVEEAKRLLEEALQLAPGFVSPYVSLALCGHYRDLSHPHIDFIKYRLEKGCLHPIARTNLHFALGASYEKLGLWNEAFAQFKAGNDITWKRVQELVSINERAEYSDQQMQTFDSEFLESMRAGGDERSGESLIFIVGMPRSGSTLTEQILASHPEVFAGGERQDLALAIEDVCAELNEPYPACIRRLDRETIGSIGKRYLERASELFDGRARFVDKMLFNYMEIGLIAAIFPNAKVIHCQRDPLDSCVSSYCKNLQSCHYTHDLRTLGLVYRQYERLMAYWHSVLPGRILDVQYEEMVTDPETQIRRLLAHCELPWHPGCLNPHQTKRPVNTASAGQVNSPINTRSIGRWKNYEKHLGLLIEALSDLGTCKMPV
jgi:tetratricopeptide (TPR) repeat protein